MRVPKILSGLALALVLNVAPALAGDLFTQDEINTLLKGIVADNLLPSSRLEMPYRGSISPGDDSYGPYIGLKVLPGQMAKNGAVNSELAVDYPYNEGDKIRYSWRMKIPYSGFAPDSPANRWWLVARWNDQPNPRMGEKPEDFLGHNPSIMIGYRQAEGKNSLYLSYGIPEALTTGPLSITQDEWVKFCLEVTWSRTDKGSARLYINNSKLPLREVTGRNMYGKYHNIFRLGNYRNAEIQTQGTLQFGDVKVERVQ